MRIIMAVGALTRPPFPLVLSPPEDVTCAQGRAMPWVLLATALPAALIPSFIPLHPPHLLIWGMRALVCECVCVCVRPSNTCHPTHTFPVAENIGRGNEGGLGPGEERERGVYKRVVYFTIIHTRIIPSSASPAPRSQLVNGRR